MKTIILLTFSILTIFLSPPVNAQFWNLSNNEIGVNELATTNDGSVYYLVNQMNLYKSQDDGDLNSWNQLSGYPMENTYKTFTKGGTIFLLNANSIGYDGRGVFASQDGGQTWNQMNDGLQGDTNVINMFSLDDDVLLLQTYTDQNTKKLYRSTNNGATWDFIMNFPDFVVSVTSISNNGLLMCTYSGLYRSIDNGLNWTNTNSTSPTGFKKIIEKGNGDLILITDSDILESTDGGDTFSTKITFGLPNFSPSTHVVYAHGLLHDDVLYISVNEDYGIFKSEDEGETWTNIDYNLPENLVFDKNLVINENGYLFAAPFLGGVYRSTSPVADSAVGLSQNESSKNNISIFPNPTDDLITISVDESIENFNIEIRNFQGKLVSSESSEINTQIQIEINGNPGIYLVKVYNDNFSYTEKVVKK